MGREEKHHAVRRQGARRMTLPKIKKLESPKVLRNQSTGEWAMACLRFLRGDITDKINELVRRVNRLTEMKNRSQKR